MPRSFDSVFYGAAGTSGEASDDQFNRVSFLSHFDGANNGVNNAFDDGSTSNHTITANGNVTQGSFGPFARPDGEWGVSFDGDGDYLDANDGPTFGTGAFTIEFFVNHRAITGLNNYIMFDSRPTSTNGLYPMIYINSSGTLQYYVSSSSVISGGTMTTNTWHHVAVSRTSTSTKMFLDGTQVGSTYSDSNNYVDSGRMRVGSSAYPAAGAIDGVISNVRVVNSALYTSNFTAPTGKLTAVTNTKLLTCQSNRFVDNSADGLTMTPSGNSAVTAFGPFLTSAVYDPAVNGASAYFDGTGDDLVAANSTDFDLSSGDFTIAMWIYPNSSSPTGNVEGLITKAFYSLSGNSGWQLWWQILSGSVGSLRFLTSSGSSNAFFNGTQPFYGNQWSYVTVVRTGNTLKLFSNGVQELSSAISDFTNYTGTLTIGSTTNWSSDNYFSGYMCDVFICKGTAVYTSNFTPPTAPLTAVTNTKLLLNMADGQAIDSAAQNNLTLYGTAKLSTGQAKFGDTSILFDGNSDYFSLYNSPLAFGSGDFTVEVFLRLNSASGDGTIFDGRPSGSQGAYPLLFVSDGELKYYVSTGYRIQYGTALNADTWYHIALCRSGTSTKLFLDGTQVGSTYSDSNNYLSGLAHFGAASRNSSTYLNGYLDEIRISRMARYTSNFTAPTEPFADKGQ